MGLHYNSTLPAGIMPMPTTAAEVGALQDFVHGIVQIYSPLEFTAQVYTVLAVVAALVVGAVAVVLKRLLTGRAYLLQFYPSRYGTYVIPNSTLAFASFLGVYAILLMGYFPLMVRWQRDSNFFLWHVLIWIPLWVGAWFCAWGTVASFPDALRIKRTNSAGELHEYLIRPIIYNLACWATPIILFASVTPPAVLADRLMDKTNRTFDAWTARADALKGPEAGPQEIQMLYDDGMDIWRQTSKAWWYYSICMTVWVFWAGAAFLVYAPIGVHTLRRVREAVEICETKMRRQQMETFYLFSSRPPGMTGGAAAAAAVTAAGSQGRVEPPDNLTTAPRPMWGTSATLKKSRSPSGTPSVRGTEENYDAEADDEEDLGRLPCDEDEERSMAIAREEMSISGRGAETSESEAPQAAVFPPLRPQQRRPRQETFRPGRDTKQQQKDDKPKSGPTTVAARRYKILRRIYRNLLILIIAVSIAILDFMAITGYISGQQYAAARKNGYEAGRVQQIANLWAAWTDVVFGGLTIGALLWRSFDSTLTVRAEDANGGGNGRATTGRPSGAAMSAGRPYTIDRAQLAPQPVAPASNKSSSSRGGSSKTGRSRILAAANAAISSKSAGSSTKKAESSKRAVEPEEERWGSQSAGRSSWGTAQRRERSGEESTYETTFHEVGEGDVGHQAIAMPAVPPSMSKPEVYSRRFAGSNTDGQHDNAADVAGLGLGLGFPAPLRQFFPASHDTEATNKGDIEQATSTGDELQTPRTTRRVSLPGKKRPTSPHLMPTNVTNAEAGPSSSPSSASLGRRAGFGLSMLGGRHSPNPAKRRPGSSGKHAGQGDELGSFFEPEGTVVRRDDSLDLFANEQEILRQEAALRGGTGPVGDRARGIRRVGPGDMGILDALALVSPPVGDGEQHHDSNALAAGSGPSSYENSPLGAAGGQRFTGTGSAPPIPHQLNRTPSTEPSRYGGWRRPSAASVSAGTGGVAR